jgi:hypothetical protein
MFSAQGLLFSSVFNKQRHHRAVVQGKPCDSAAVTRDIAEFSTGTPAKLAE